MRSWSCRLSTLRRLAATCLLPLSTFVAEGVEATAAPEAHLPEPVANREVVVGLDAVFRLAAEQNTTIAQARVRVAEAEATALVAEHSCVPNLLRSEANRKSAADAKVWQQRAELARTTQEVLQEAGSTYYDWLAARRGESVSRGLLAKEEKLLGRARALAKDEQAANVLVETIETTLAGRRQSIRKFQYQATAAAAKLAYLLNLSGTSLVPADADLTVVELFALDQPVDVLVAQVRNSGPGISELANLEAAVEKAISDARCLQTGCNLTGKPSLCGRLDAANARLEQVHLARLDLAGKWEALVREACAAMEDGREEIGIARDQVNHASEAYRLANLRLDDMVSAATLGEVLQSIRSLEAGHFGWLQAVNSYNKAQVRLHVVLTSSATH